MRFTITGLTLLVLLCCFISPLAAFQDEGAADQPAQEDKLSMYRAYSGKWISVTKGKATDVIEQPYENVGHWEQRDILDGKMIEMRGKDGPEGEEFEYLWLYTYDNREEKYVAWFHDGRGINTKMYGSWSAEKKQMVWTLIDPEAWGFRVTIVDDLSRKDEIRYHFKMVGLDGTVICDESGVGQPKRRQAKQ